MLTETEEKEALEVHFNALLEGLVAVLNGDYFAASAALFASTLAAQWLLEVTPEDTKSRLFDPLAERLGIDPHRAEEIWAEAYEGVFGVRPEAA